MCIRTRFDATVPSGTSVEEFCERMAAGIRARVSTRRVAVQMVTCHLNKHDDGFSGDFEVSVEPVAENASVEHQILICDDAVCSSVLEAVA